MDWKLSTGKKRMGQVVGVSSSGVIMVWKAMDDAREISVSFSEFADESLLLMPKAINHFPRKVSRSSNDKNALQVALDKFRNEYGCMPHYAIVDQAGTPLLSWRVALLPYMGYSELFGMFRLDEPWDSPHNQKLLPMMPVYYNLTQPGLELGQATIKAITGPGTAFPIDAICSLKDLDKPALDVLLFVETKGDHSIPWTKPEDIVVSTDPTWQEHLHSAKLDNQQWNLKWYGDGKLKFEPFPVGRKPME